MILVLRFVEIRNFVAVVFGIDLGLFEGLGSKDGRVGCGSYWGTYWTNILYWVRFEEGTKYVYVSRESISSLSP